MKPQQFCIKALFALMVILASCKNNKEEMLSPGPTPPSNCTTVSAKFSSDILPLITNRCATASCHSAGARAGGRVLTNYDQINNAKERIKERVIIEKSMPPSGPLPAAEINLLKCWIENGAPNN